MAHKFHNRLDLKLSTMEYSSAECGSLNLETGRKEFCDVDCPNAKGIAIEVIDKVSHQSGKAEDVTRHAPGK